MKQLKIAVIGSGISGISASWLLQKNHQVTLFEKDSRLGGHVHTVEIPSGPSQGVAVDTGFIVCNDRNYPHLHHLFAELGVQVRNSDMSFGYWDEISGMAYSGRGIAGLLANPLNLFKADFYRAVRDFIKFNRIAKEILAQGRTPEAERLGDFLSYHGLSEAFVRHYLVPMGAAIWSTSNEEMLDFPTSVFLHFFENHGLLSIKDRPQWQTVVGGSHAYVKAFAAQFQGRIVMNAGIQSVKRLDSGVEIHFEQGHSEIFDRVVMAIHADHVLSLLADATEREKELFGVWKFQKNRAVLHTDSRVLPSQKAAHASWNFIYEKSPKQKHPVAVSYDMNRLQGIKGPEHFLVSLNLERHLDQSQIVKTIDYEHPSFNPKTLASRAQIRALSGQGGISYVGAWFHNGFHEDGIRSSVEMVEREFGFHWSH